MATHSFTHREPTVTFPHASPIAHAKALTLQALPFLWTQFLDSDAIPYHTIRALPFLSTKPIRHI